MGCGVIADLRNRFICACEAGGFVSHWKSLRWSVIYESRIPVTTMSMISFQQCSFTVREIKKRARLSALGFPDQVEEN